MRTDPVRDLLEGLGDWWGNVRGWRKLSIGGIIAIILIILLLIVLTILTVYIVRGLSSGKFKNKELYIPRVKL